jgi:hypothetical protein
MKLVTNPKEVHKIVTKFYKHHPEARPYLDSGIRKPIFDPALQDELLAKLGF